MSSDAADDIMDGTHSALRTHGYAALTMQDIADEAGLSKAALHYHFDCKHDLLLSFLDRLYGQFEARIADPPGDDPAEQLLSLIETVMLPPADDDPHEFRTALLEIEAQAPYDESFRERLERFDDAFTERIRSILAAGVEDGTFREDVDPDEAASFVATYVRGARTQNVAVGTPLDDSLSAFRSYVESTLLPASAEVDTE
ncbi:TetR/AcrR family transcriptional regulator [Halogeometricum borinquense]|uniref:TetR/AcrR family transcriptional regulator n=1 Tax=Halogeometricum borinquense TaxID=60847 RepID=A0A6C0UJL3_9EURY|nr:TetR/AcrR family transcriptional regulator [Halogeometricum borinquense]QIB74039.1 TetR/AcrR family transcriptional regulator [Halogeometricum borinquense]